MVGPYAPQRVKCCDLSSFYLLISSMSSTSLLYTQPRMQASDSRADSVEKQSQHEQLVSPHFAPVTSIGTRLAELPHGQSDEPPLQEPVVMHSVANLYGRNCP